MSKNLSDFVNSNTFDKTKNEKQNIDPVEFFQKHQGKNSVELQEELKKEVERQKSLGTFDFNKLKNSADSIMPLLNENQKEFINSILQGMK